MASDLRSELPSEASSGSQVEAAGSKALDAREERADLGLVRPPTATIESGEKEAVPAAKSAESGESVAAATSEHQGIPVWIALLGLLIAALILSYQMRVNGQLEAEVTGLEAELSRTQVVLDAHKTHLTEIRGGVRDLSTRLQSLQTLVETEPVVARDARDAREDRGPRAIPAP